MEWKINEVSDGTALAISELNKTFRNEQSEQAGCPTKACAVAVSFWNA